MIVKYSTSFRQAGEFGYKQRRGGGGEYIEAFTITEVNQRISLILVSTTPTTQTNFYDTYSYKANFVYSA